MIVIAKDTAFHIAKLLQFLIQGENLAKDCAKQQAELCQISVQKKFLKRQYRQEFFHAKVFGNGIKLLNCRSLGSPLGATPMQQYRELIEAALRRGDFAESILGMQIILEGLGDVTLERSNTRFLNSGTTFDRLRQIVLNQEDAHHQFGLDYFQSNYTQPAEIPEQLISRAKDYVHLTHEMLDSVQSLFEYFDVDANHYKQLMFRDLPDWIKV